MQKDDGTAASQHLIMHNRAIEENNAQKSLPKLAKNSFQTNRELIGSKGRKKVVFRACIQALLNFAFLAFGGEKDNGYIAQVGGRLHDFAGFVTGHARHSNGDKIGRGEESVVPEASW